jgi:hypothetical protein
LSAKFDMTFPYEVTIPLLKDIETQAPQATCEVGMASESIGMLVNRAAAPFDNPELRRAMAPTLDRDRGAGHQLDLFPGAVRPEIAVARSAGTAGRQPCT